MFVSLAEYLHHHPHRPNYEINCGKNYIFPRLSRAKAPTTDITTFLKKTLQDRAATANGVRPGVSNFLAQYMPAEFIVRITGHDMRHESALWEYLDCDVALLIPGAKALAGWKPAPFGQIGEAPRHADLKPIKDSGVSQHTLDTMMNEMFHLHRNSPPQMQASEWQPDDRFTDDEKAVILAERSVLRPVIEACFASLIMHFKTRKDKDEMRSVSQKLIQLVSRHLLCEDPVTKLEQWSTLVDSKFRFDNCHLLDPVSSSGQVIRVARWVCVSTCSQQSADPSLPVASSRPTHAAVGRPIGQHWQKSVNVG